MTEYIKLLSIFMGASWLVGCGVLTPVSTDQIAQVPLQVNTTCQVSHITTQHSLYIPVASALEPYDSTSMIYQTKSELKAYTYHKWVAPPAEQLRQTIASAIRHNGLFRSVWAGPSANGDKVNTLNIQLTRFSQDLMQQRFHAALVISFNASDHHKLQAKTFNVMVPSAPNYRGMINAANQAAQQLTCQVAHWLIQTA